MDDRTFEQEILPQLLELHREPLDPNLVAAYVDGSLHGEELASVRARLAADPEAMLLVRALQEEEAGTHADPRAPVSADAPVPGRPGAPVGRGGAWRPAAAALVLFAVGAAAFLLTGRGPSAAPLPERLAEVAHRLRVEEPALFADFLPLSADDLERQASVSRGGVVWLGPRGVVLAAPDVFRWRNPRGATRAEVRLAGPALDWRREVAGERIAAPPLAPGRYVVTLRALDSLAAQSTRRTFVVADAEAAERYRQAVARIRERAPADIADVLVAHYALRARLVEEARAVVEGSTSTDVAVRQAMDELARAVADPHEP